MSSSEINLIGAGKSLSITEERTKKVITKVIPLIIISYLVTSGILMSYWFFLKSKYNLVLSRINQESTRIKDNQKYEGIYLLVKNKASRLEQIVYNREKYYEAIKLLQNLENESIQINQATLNNTGEIELTISIQNLESLDQLITKLINDLSQKFDKVQLSSIGFDKEGTYHAVFNLLFRQI